MSEITICGDGSNGINRAVDGKLHLYSSGVRVLTVEPSHINIYARVTHAVGSDANSANVLTMSVNGGLFNILGTTTIKHITTTGRSAGDTVICIFKGILIVENNAGSPPGGTAPIYLTGGVSFITQANSTLSLVYDGTAWFETGRKV